MEPNFNEWKTYDGLWVSRWGNSGVALRQKELHTDNLITLTWGQFEALTGISKEDMKQTWIKLGR